MKFFWNYIFPVIFGMTVYASIRLVNDTTDGTRFWERPLQTNLVEIAAVIIVTFIFQRVINRMIHYFQSKQPEFISRKNILKEFGLVYLAVFLIIHIAIVPLLIFTDDGMQINDYVIANIIPTLFNLLYFAIVRGNQYLNNFVKQKIQLEKITNDSLQTELKFLKAQYHPHFLFNALNTIYFQMDENVGEAKKTVEKFSELLRYQLYDQQQTVPVSREIEYLKNFIDIQKVRATERLQLNTFFDDQLNGQQVYPLLFLPLVENAFKYVGGDYKIDISAKSNPGNMQFSVINSLPQMPVPEKQNGIGLENLRRRLDLLYPGKYELTINKDSKSFKATLKLPTQS